MQQNQIVNEYLQILVFLNKGNKIANTKTLLDFEIIPTDGDHRYQLFAFVTGSGEKNRIMLAMRSRSKTWERAGYTAQKNLENFCAELLNKTEKKDEEAQKDLKQKHITELINTIRTAFKNLSFFDSDT